MRDAGRFREDGAGAAKAAAPGAAALGTPQRLDGLRLLLVDDEREALEMARLLLEQCGADVSTASSAAEGFRLLKELRPDVLISDIEMPGEDGYGLINRVRSLGPEEGGNTHSIALTAHARPEDRLKALGAGFARTSRSRSRRPSWRRSSRPSSAEGRADPGTSKSSGMPTYSAPPVAAREAGGG